MILGLGNDIIEISRIRSSHSSLGQPFLNRIFTLQEQAYCQKYQDPFPHFAGRFAAKEALAKALSSGFGSQLSWVDLEILANPQGKPEVFVSEKIKELFDNPILIVTISHCREYAIATALWLSSKK